MLYIPHAKRESFNFRGLSITDYAQEQVKSASIARIEVAPGVRHQTARSTLSDKFYFCLEGRVSFQVGGESVMLHPFDLLIILKNEWFSYSNDTGEPSHLLLFHAPPFNLEAEEFKEE